MNLPKDVHKYARRINSPVINEALSGLDTYTAPYQFADRLRRINIAFEGDDSYKSHFFSHLSLADCSRLLSDSHEIEYLHFLAQNKLLPLPNIMNLKNPKALEKSRLDFRLGKFDPNDEIHLELEYSRCADRFYKGTFDSFRSLPFYDESVEFVDPLWKVEAANTAKDAVVALDHIISASLSGIPSLVIGNARYGSDFVVEPIEEYLSKANIHIMTTHIPSFGLWFKPGMPVSVPKSLDEKIKVDKPNIFFVDGTKCSLGDGGLTRFPSSVCGIINAFDEYNQASEEVKYALRFWSPNLTKNFYTGEVGHVSRQDPEGKTVRFLTIVSSVKNSGAYFDDPEHAHVMYKNTKVLTKFGYDIKTLEFNVNDLTSLWKRLVKEEVERLLVLK